MAARAPGRAAATGAARARRRHAQAVPVHRRARKIAAAVLGLFGHPATDTESAFARAARQVTIPVLFLQQWDDELFSRDDCLALFDLLASEDKTLHANPGGHLGVPRAELGGAVHFLRRRLGGDNSGGDNSGGGDPGSPVALAGVRYYVRRVPSPGDTR
jgi:fermentation-respiration switch protein FrsA (DUF1100 family)